MPKKMTYEHWMTNDNVVFRTVKSTETAEEFTARQREGFDQDDARRKEHNKVIETDIKEIEEILNGEEELDERAKGILEENIKNLKTRLAPLAEFTFLITGTDELGEKEFPNKKDKKEK